MTTDKFKTDLLIVMYKRKAEITEEIAAIEAIKTERDLIEYTMNVLRKRMVDAEENK